MGLQGITHTHPTTSIQKKKQKNKKKCAIRHLQRGQPPCQAHAILHSHLLLWVSVRRDLVQVTSALGALQDPGHSMRTKSGNLCEGLGPLPSLWQMLYQRSTMAHEASGVCREWVGIVALTEYGGFINWGDEADFGKGPRHLS